MLSPAYADLRAKVELVRRRLLAHQVLTCTLEGACWGAAVGCLALLLGWFQIQVPTWFPLLAGGSGIVLGAAVGWRRAVTDRMAARWIDRHGRLSDRVVSALEFMQLSDPTATQRLQMADAVTHAQAVEAVPRMMPADGWRGGFAIVLLLGMTALALTAPPASPQQPSRAIEDASGWAAQLETQLQTDQATHPDLQPLADQLRALSATWTPTRDQETELARQHQLEVALADQRQALAEGANLSLWTELAQQLRGHWPTRAAGEALKAGDPARAAAEFSKISWELLDPAQRKALARQLQRLARKAEAGSPLAEAMDELQQALAARDATGWDTARETMVAALQEQADRLQGLAWLDNQRLALHTLRQQQQRGRFATATAGSPALAEPSLDVAFTDPEILVGEVGTGATETRRRVAVPESAVANRPVVARTFRPREAVAIAVSEDPIPLAYRECVWRYFQPQAAPLAEAEATR
ncbi:MAG: hypothetical protein AAGF97_03405 [Planctomycetota bacterium]